LLLIPRFVRVRAADVDALSAALGEPVRSEAVTDALRLHAGHRREDQRFPDPVVALVVLAARVAGGRVLDLDWTRNAELLWSRLDQPVDAAGDVVLTAAEEAAYSGSSAGSTTCGPRPSGRPVYLLTA